MQEFFEALERSGLADTYAWFYVQGMPIWLFRASLAATIIVLYLVINNKIILPQITRKGLFSANGDFVTELDAMQLNDTIRKQFEIKSYQLTQQAQVRINRRGSKWTIVDGSSRYKIIGGEGKVNIFNDNNDDFGVIFRFYNRYTNLAIISIPIMIFVLLGMYIINDKIGYFGEDAILLEGSAAYLRLDPFEVAYIVDMQYMMMIASIVSFIFIMFFTISFLIVDVISHWTLGKTVNEYENRERRSRAYMYVLGMGIFDAILFLVVMSFVIVIAYYIPPDRRIMVPQNSFDSRGTCAKTNGIEVGRVFWASTEENKATLNILASFTQRNRGKKLCVETQGLITGANRCVNGIGSPEDFSLDIQVVPIVIDEISDERLAQSMAIFSQLIGLCQLDQGEKEIICDAFENSSLIQSSSSGVKLDGNDAHDRIFIHLKSSLAGLEERYITWPTVGYTIVAYRSDISSLDSIDLAASAPNWFNGDSRADTDPSRYGKLIILPIMGEEVTKSDLNDIEGVLENLKKRDASLNVITILFSPSIKNYSKKSIEKYLTFYVDIPEDAIIDENINFDYPQPFMNSFNEQVDELRLIRLYQYQIEGLWSFRHLGAFTITDGVTKCLLGTDDNIVRFDDEVYVSGNYYIFLIMILSYPIFLLMIFISIFLKIIGYNDNSLRDTQ